MAESSPAENSPAIGLLRTVERRAQVRAGAVRFMLALILYLVIDVAAEGLPASDMATMKQVEAGKAFAAAFGVVGLGVFLLARWGIGTHVLPFATVLLDATLILGNLAWDHFAPGIPGNLTFAFVVVWVVPIALAANAIYFRPALQLFSTAIYAVGIPIISLSAGYLGEDALPGALARLERSMTLPPNAVRLAMLLSTGILLVLAAFQGRRLIERVVEETVLRLNLTRYLPRELAPVLSEDGFAELRAGQRLQAALLFVDIRGSTAMGSAMDPTALARFVNAFRRRVSRAAAEHGGVIDKFIGDGALIVFGVPRPDASDPARALACAKTLVALVGRWNAKRRFEPPVQIGVGVHCGEVFCGVLGEEDRLEFTVLGDPVNVASRLESATKRLGGPLLASADIVEAAGELPGIWIEVSRDPLPGVGRPIVILKPQPGGRPDPNGVHPAGSASGAHS